MTLSKFLVSLLVLNIGTAASFSPSLIEKANVAHSTDSSDLESSRRNVLTSIVASAAVLGSPLSASARLEAVNRPDLLPSEKGTHVIQTEKFLTSGQARRMDQLLQQLETDTGFRVYVLCQNYPNTPGLAIRDFWDLGKEVGTNDQ